MSKTASFYLKSKVTKISKINFDELFLKNSDNRKIRKVEKVEKVEKFG